MVLSRRKFVSGVGATLTYAICVRYGVSDAKTRSPAYSRHAGLINRLYPGTYHKDWIKISADGYVSVHTARNEIGQGLQTVIVNVLSQGLELPPENIHVLMGDTLLCPNDGPTTGSNATRHIVWSFWLSCFEIRQDLIQLAAQHLGVPAKKLVYSNGEISAGENSNESVTIFALANDQVRDISIDETSTLPVDVPNYRDPGSVNVNARSIVTGSRTFTSDLPFENHLYGGFLLPPYHLSLSKSVSLDFSETLAIAGVRKAEKLRGNRIAVLGDTYTAVQKGLAAIKARWQEPDYPEEMSTESVIRDGRKFVKVVDQKGNPGIDLDSGHTVVSETYLSQYGTQVPIETDTALAEKTADGFVIRLGTQSPFKVRDIIAQHFKLATDAVRVIAMPTGGAFGAKSGHRVGLEAAILAQWAGQPVKLVQSRKYDIQGRGRYKAAVVFDISSVVGKNGRLVSRNIDIHQDVGHGTTNVYEVPNILTSLYKTDLPFKRAIMRGTSYTQSVWALESHMDMLAVAAKIDPLDFRRRNVSSRHFPPLVDSCKKMMGYSSPNPEKGKGVGFGMIYHGGAQYGVVGAEVDVDFVSGEVRVVKMAGAFDVGLVVNSTLARTGVESAMLWGLSWALLEGVKVDGHSCHTSGFGNYKIARFSDVPEMRVRFLNDSSGTPRGCGEMPLPAAIAAVSNAVFHATGIRFHTLPITAERVRAALV